MLVAKFSSGKPLVLTDYYTKEKLELIRKTEDLYCPTCHSPVILKLGTKKQWHFAHVKESAICKSFERESPFHLLGKKQLYAWLKRYEKAVFLERYLPTISQRPDIYYERSSKKVAIEFQCSPIPLELHYKRTISYLKNNIYPLWIIGANRLERTGGNFFTLHPYEWSSTFHIKTERFPLLLYYCPFSKRFILLRNIISIGKNKVMATLESKTIQKISLFHEIFSKRAERIKQDDWLQLKKHWRYSVSPYPSKAQQFFNNYCYDRRLTSFLYPAESGWPIEYSTYIETPLHIWQSWIFYEFITNKSKEDLIGFRTIYEAFKQKVVERIFSVRTLPLQNGHYSYAIMNYLHLLCKFQVLQKRGKDTFCIVQIPKPLNTIEEALILDQKYGNMINFS